MTEVEALLKATIGEMERLLATKTVIGEPITAGEKTVIPLLSVGAGFGVGAGSGKGDEGMGGGAGGGFGMRPVAVIVIEEDAVRVEPVRKGGGSLIEQLADNVPQLIKKVIDEREERKQEESAEKKGEGKEKGKEIQVE
ncbi:GerW family sporulation protein [Candidatus Methanocrinis natronophilus]|uniref:Spore germination protein GerW family protein n=1 Tax=Candidatus Methanocrinis natronophilus TaxID=3033396 RepID=A0ABT5X6L2_9EURY|nr:spore germination protein GerW family protein [Candidatus Methanocrinis natronophilus]MDF0590334.1 spore germination protein GerW family protein [Candidatus Methanocrinis natronophilus]